MHHIVRLTWVWIPLQSIIYSACPVPVCQFISGTELCNLLSRQSMTWSSYWPRQCMSLPICHWTSSTTVWLICTTLTAGRVSCSDVCVNLLVFSVVIMATTPLTCFVQLCRQSQYCFAYSQCVMDIYHIHDGYSLLVTPWLWWLSSQSTCTVSSMLLTNTQNSPIWFQAARAHDLLS